MVIENQVESQRNMVNCCTDLAEIVSAFGQCHPPHFGAKLESTRHLAGQPSEILSPQYDNRLLQRDIFMVTAPSMAVYALPFYSLRFKFNPR